MKQQKIEENEKKTDCRKRNAIVQKDLEKVQIEKLRLRSDIKMEVFKLEQKKEKHLAQINEFELVLNVEIQ